MTKTRCRSARIPAGSLKAALTEVGQADIFLTYCTNALQARKENAELKIVEVPSAWRSARSTG